MLAVTTRNRLRRARFCLPMLRARRLIARQLANQPGLIRYASGVSSPTEFFTLTVWENRESMQRFMQSGAHEQHMWLFAQWSASFWGMRWEPTSHEVGTWAGLALGRDSSAPPPVSPLVATGILPANPPRAGAYGPRFEGSPVEPRTSGIFALTARCDGALSALRALRRQEHQSAIVRWAVGVDWSPQALCISLWRDLPGARQQALAVAETDLAAPWAMCWQPADYEIGHWDGLRLRQVARQLTRSR